MTDTRREQMMVLFSPWLERHHELLRDVPWQVSYYVWLLTCGHDVPDGLREYAADARDFYANWHRERPGFANRVVELERKLKGESDERV